MMDVNIIITVAICIIFLLIFGKIFLLPVKKIFKLVINTGLGALAIFIINTIGTSFGFHIGLNIINALIVGILGIPGAVLLILLKIFCNIG
mgnify:CR=1 FL=1